MFYKIKLLHKNNRFKVKQCSKRNAIRGRGGRQVVSVLAFYSDDPSSNHAEACSFSAKFVFGKNENKQKRSGLAHVYF